MASRGRFGFAGRSRRLEVGLSRSGGLEPAPRRDQRGGEVNAGVLGCCPAGARRSRHSGRDPDRSGQAARATNLKAFLSNLPEEALSVFDRGSG
jgi:hypothetical protein